MPKRTKDDFNKWDRRWPTSDGSAGDKPQRHRQPADESAERRPSTEPPAETARYRIHLSRLDLQCVEYCLTLRIEKGEFHDRQRRLKQRFRDLVQRAILDLHDAAVALENRPARKRSPRKS